MGSYDLAGLRLAPHADRIALGGTLDDADKSWLRIKSAFVIRALWVGFHSELLRETNQAAEVVSLARADLGFGFSQVRH